MEKQQSIITTKKLNLRGKNFAFAPVAPGTILKLLKQLNPAKSAGIDNLTGKLLKEGAPVLASPITDLVNLSISLSLFPDDCKIAKLKPLYKKEAKTKPKKLHAYFPSPAAFQDNWKNNPQPNTGIFGQK